MSVTGSRNSDVPTAVLIPETALWCPEEVLPARFSFCNIGCDRAELGDLGCNEINNYCFTMEVLQRSQTISFAPSEQILPQLERQCYNGKNCERVAGISKALDPILETAVGSCLVCVKKCSRADQVSPSVYPQLEISGPQENLIVSVISPQYTQQCAFSGAPAS